MQLARSGVGTGGLRFVENPLQRVLLVRRVVDERHRRGDVLRLDRAPEVEAARTDASEATARVVQVRDDTDRDRRPSASRSAGAAPSAVLSLAEPGWRASAVPPQRVERAEQPHQQHAASSHSLARSRDKHVFAGAQSARGRRLRDAEDLPASVALRQAEQPRGAHDRAAEDGARPRSIDSVCFDGVPR